MSNHFTFVAPMFNASRYLRQFVLSLAGQSYNDWSIIVVDDLSTDDSVERIARLFRELGIEDKLKLHVNTEKLWEVENVLQCIAHPTVKESDIICRIDPDDYLCDLNALELLNRVYSDGFCDAAWTAHRWFDDRGVTMQNISGPMVPGANPYTHPWVSSHLKTFRKSLISRVSDANFRGEDGRYIRRAGDQAIFLPVLHEAKHRVYVPVVTYAYRCDMRPETFQTADAKFQAREAEFLRGRGFVR